MTLKISALPAALAVLLLITIGSGQAAAQTTFIDPSDADLRIDIINVTVENDFQYLIIDYGNILINSELIVEGDPNNPSGSVIVWNETAQCEIQVNDHIVSIWDTSPGESVSIEASGGIWLGEGVVAIQLSDLGDVDDVNISITTSYSEAVSGYWDFDYAPDSGSYLYSIPTTNTNEPPVMTYLAVSPEVIWPPNNRERTITLMVDAYDPDDDTFEYFYSIVDEYGEYTCSDEPLIGDIRLMASRRDYDRDGRTYTITVTVVDTEGESDSMSVTVLVPHDRGKRKK